jgi:ABC-type Fe3+-siderophore transport system permease subunit
MAFYKWKAYDFNLKYHDGAMECSRHELVVMKLAERELVPSNIETIDYIEYKILKTAETRIGKFKNKIDNQDEPIFRWKLNWGRIILIILAGAGLVVAAIFLANLQSPRHF